MVKPALVVSVVILVGLVVEWSLLGTLGTVRSREVIGPVFYPFHLGVFFLSIPALANILVIGRPRIGVRRWLMASVLCAALDLPLVLTQYAVSEALYGIDGTGGPFATE